MSVFEILVCVLFPCVVGLLGWAAGLDRRLKQQEKLSDRRSDTFHTALANLAKTVCDLDEKINGVDERLTKLGGEFKELPKEEMEAEYQRLVSFNTGIQNIIGFGPDVPKLNKEALRRNE